ncbi:uncharacterized protein [Dysidea avara]|uniref:uncharacterized protein isoform X2 n=1 Tax=Dysidea avara TaxID=196820 RepID=UPI00332C3943
MEFKGDESMSATIQFVRMMDKLFDTFNVNNFTTGKHQLKLFQDPYRSNGDFRLTWLKDEFKPYLEKWEKSVMETTGYSNKEKTMMLMPQQTRLGIDATISSFLELVPYLFSIPEVKTFLSEKLSQDSLEKLFSCLRQQGGTNENPNMQSFCKAMQSLRVVNTVCRNMSNTGNCRGNKNKTPLDMELESQPLPKRRRKDSSATGSTSKEYNSISNYENILVVSLKEIMNDDSFRIQSASTIQLRHTAECFLQWCENLQNTATLTSFSVGIIEELSTTIKSSITKSYNYNREKLWKNYFVLRTSKRFIKKWTDLINIVNIAIKPPLYQHLTDIIFKGQLQNYFKILHSEQQNNEPMHVTQTEKNILRYIAGYICR